MEPITILIADDHVDFRAGLRALLEAADDLEICGESATVVEALNQATTLQPDVIMMDINMPGLNGFEVQ